MPQGMVMVKGIAIYKKYKAQASLSSGPNSLSHNQSHFVTLVGNAFNCIARNSARSRFIICCPTVLQFKMKIYSISVALAPPSGASAVLSSANDLSSFSFYQRGSVGEFMNFFTKTVVERTAQGQRQSVKESSYTAHIYNRGGAEQLAGIWQSTC